MSGFSGSLWCPRWCVRLGARQIEQGERASWWMGYAWYLPYSDGALFMPMPFNWIAAWIRGCWIKARSAHVRDEMLYLHRWSVSRGFREGRENGIRRGLEMARVIYEENQRA